MKSVLRSAFDPVPRPLSTGAQLLVVGLLIVGITISVAEYLQHSRPALLAQEPTAAPALAAPQLHAAKPAEAVLRPRSLVRVAPRPESGTSSSSASPDRPFAGSSREPSASATAPMLVQPGEDG